MAVASLTEIELALKNTLGKKGMEEEDLKKLAEYVASFFGYAGSVIDNRLASEDRDIFYMLEEEGLLTTMEEEVHLKKGKMWRIHYWMLKTDQVIRLASMESHDSDDEEMLRMYEGLPSDVWGRE
ncbi:DUF6015 family protein [Candidatus Methanomassiliicoccus intestinalis]|uniref:DUF6015 family protein n=1 Tax=Candidatus Methanomassiliicoccus intestinalis TaxID=1406512 RepID=UPI0037DC172F